MRRVLVVMALMPGLAEAREIEVAAGTSELYATARSMDAVASNNGITLGTLEASVEIGRLQVVDRLHLEASYLAGSTSAEDFGQFDATLVLQTLNAGVRADHILSPRWRAYGRLDIGMTFADLELADRSGSATPIRDDGRSVSALFGLGLDVAVMRLPYFDVGLRGEVDYFAATSVAFQAQPGYPDDDLARIPVAAADLGSLNPSGAAWRIALVGRF